MHLENISTGVLFRNEKPHLKSIHAYFPSVALMPDGSLISMYVLGEAFEAINQNVYLSRSADNGWTWKHLGAVCKANSDNATSTFGRIAATEEGELIANLVRFDRSLHPQEGLSHPETLGLAPSEMILIRSRDGGETWSDEQKIFPPLDGPEFEMCSPVTFLRDGRWILPTSTWRDWEGKSPHGDRMVAFVSEDRGKTWPRYFDIMHSGKEQLFFWESKIVEFPDGRLLAVAWCYDEVAKEDRPNQFSISDDGGETWSPYASTGLCGQTLTPLLLEDGKILNIYRRMDRPGLWACVAELDRGNWVNLWQQPLWGHNSQEGLTIAGENMSENFAALKFGAPHILRLPDGDLFVTFWCYEQCVSVIRWFRFNLDQNPA